MQYGEIVMDHFFNPRNCFRMEKPDLVGKAGEPGRGPFMLIYLRTDGARIRDASFQTGGAEKPRQLRCACGTQASLRQGNGRGVRRGCWCFEWITRYIDQCGRIHGSPSPSNRAGAAIAPRQQYNANKGSSLVCIACATPDG